ncbi:hypothetical protein MYCGRDRAFT_94991 [Paecilomyces variotii No. 5]|uniref:JmjC domain-containing protein n=1 Tax=Byssochlamys spectabilis (strain No. 5 / NBRC 109023) TaxID=1356009 RepID=V5FA20_BYSSN|nr:hypothetical protein MYCGRDRAFT_94991 [Paecilomyces variotii No. 5]
MDSFDDETRALISLIHRAWKSQASLSEYALLRDRIIAHRDRLDVQITTLSTVVRLAVRRSPADEEQGDLNWQEFFALAATLPAEKDGDGDPGDDAVLPKASRKRPQNWNDTCRSRNLAIIVALWSPEVVQYYKWDRVGQGQMRVIRTCAVHFPDFEAAFVPRLNQVLLARHCMAILHCRERTLNEAKLQPLKDFEIEAIRSATVDLDMQDMWLTNRDGAIPLDSKGTLLKDIRPQHYRLYLLQKDRYGTLEPRENPESCPANADIANPPVATMERLIPEEDLFDLGESSPSQRMVPNCPSSIPRATVAGPTSPLPASSFSPDDSILADLAQLGCATFPDQSSVPQVFPNSFAGADPLLCPDPGRSPFDIGASWTPPRTAWDLGCSPVPSAAAQGGWTDSDCFWAHARTQSAGLLCSPELAISRLQLEEMGAAVNTRAAEKAPKETLSRGFSRARKRPRLSSALEESMLADGNGDGRRHIMDTHIDGSAPARHHTTRGLVEPLQIPATAISPLPRHQPLNLRLSSGPQLESTDRLTIEERLCNKHLPSLTDYMDSLGGLNARGQRCIQARWLTAETQWAKIWSASETLGGGRASCEDEADVIYCTAADIVAHAKAGKAFCKPTVIKESFTDRGMHTVGQILTLLQDCGTSPSGNKEPVLSSTREDRCRAPITPQWSPLSETDSGLSTASHLRNLTKSHRPIVTMLPRFRLLETLIEGHQWDNAQERMEPSPFELRACTGFNTVSRSGGFSGAHAHALYGTWSRNLDGTSYLMIVPEAEMSSEDWETFASQGDEWLSRGRERLVVLEADDVLLIPPGLRIVHAVHYPSDCLIEGGMLWDSLSVLETLHLTVWAYGNHRFTAHEPLPTDLPLIIHRLQQLVSAQPEKFQGTRSSASFLAMFESAVEELQNLLN